jgi:hypothetical protein
MKTKLKKQTNKIQNQKNSGQNIKLRLNYSDLSIHHYFKFLGSFKSFYSEIILLKATPKTNCESEKYKSQKQMEYFLYEIK